MRLIDADEIPFVNDPKHPHVEGFQTVTKTAIDNTPTVEAIPIEWIETYMQRFTLYTRWAFEGMIEEWRKKNE